MVWSQVRRWRISFAPCGWSDSSGSGWMGKGTSLLTPRSRVVGAVCTVAVRMIPSIPGWTLITRPKGHCTDGTLSTLRTTTVPSMMSWLPLLHLFRMFSSFRYSRCQRRQKCCLTLWMCCQLEGRLDGVSRKSRSRKLVNASPMRKWPGVRTRRSIGSDDIGVRVRELRIDSISMISVLSFRMLRARYLRHVWDVVWRTSLQPPSTRRSEVSWEEFDSRNFRSIRRSAKKDWTFTLWSSDCRRFRSSRNSLLAPTKLVPLSE